MKTLTDKQRELVNQHLHLVRIISKQLRTWITFEEKMSAGHLALCNAAVLWEDDGRATFRTYAEQAIKREIFHENKRLLYGGRSKSGVRIFTGDLPHWLESATEQHNHEAQIDDQDELDLWRAAVRRGLSRLTTHQLKVFEMLASGMMYKDIAERLRVQHPTCIQSFNWARKKFFKELENKHNW